VGSQRRVGSSPSFRPLALTHLRRKFGSKESDVEYTHSVVILVRSHSKVVKHVVGESRGYVSGGGETREPVRDCTKRDRERIGAERGMEEERANTPSVELEGRRGAKVSELRVG